MAKRPLKDLAGPDSVSAWMQSPLEPGIRLTVEDHTQLVQLRNILSRVPDFLESEGYARVPIVRIVFRYRGQEDDILDMDLCGRVPQSSADKIAQSHRAEITILGARRTPGMAAARTSISREWVGRQTVCAGSRLARKYRAEDARRYVVHEWSARSTVLDVFDFIMDDLNSRDHDIAFVGSTIISRYMGCSRSIAQKALTALVAADVLVKVREHQYWVNSESNRNRPTGYWVFGLERKNRKKANSSDTEETWSAVTCPEFKPSASGAAKRQREARLEMLANGGKV
ncbi:hypothetical protein ACSW29_27335 [Rhodococcus sp. GB-02]